MRLMAILDSTNNVFIITQREPLDSSVLEDLESSRRLRLRPLERLESPEDYVT